MPVSVKPSTTTSNPVLSSIPQSEDPESISSTSTSSQNNSASEGKEQGQEKTEPAPKLKLYNRTIYIHPDGTLHAAASYDKLHLFDYPDAKLRESTTTQAGTKFTPPFDSPVGRLGSLICFDLRFPEAAIHLTTTHPSSPTSTSSSSSKPYPSPAQILLYPSAFTVPTGSAHWEVLLRSRAIETQSYVIAAAQVGLHNPGLSPRVSYGRSMVVDPWGRVLVSLKGVRDDGKDAEEGAVGELGVVEIDLGEWERVRRNMPLVRRT